MGVINILMVSTVWDTSKDLLRCRCQDSIRPGDDVISHIITIIIKMYIKMILKKNIFTKMQEDKENHIFIETFLKFK